jgi:hypothetical protein
MSDIKVRVGQQNSVKVISSISGGSNFAFNAVNAENVIGGIASVTQLNVSGISTFVGIATFNDNVYIDGDLFLGQSLYYPAGQPYGVAYFDLNDQLVSTGTTAVAISETNYILSTNNSGVPTWSSVIDGGSY